MNWNPDWSSSAVTLAVVFVLCSVAVGTAAAEATTGQTTAQTEPNATADTTETTTPPPNESTATETPQPTASTPTPESNETRTPDATETPASEPTDTQTPDSGASDTARDTDFSVTALDAPQSLRAGDGLVVTATVTNRGTENGTETLRYSFGGETVDSRPATLSAGDSTTVRFEVSYADVESALGSVAPGTYVHGVRNESGAGEARRIRVTPDVDFTVETVDAPTEVAHGDPYVVLATVRNPGNTTVTRRVAYEFAGDPVVERAVTVAGDDDRQVAFEIRLSDVAAAVGPVRNQTTYDHAVATGGDRRGGAVRVVRSPSADADALAVESFEAPSDVRPGDTYRVELAVRNVDTADFEGQLSYRVDGAAVATEWTRVPIGERRTVTFRVAYDDVADALGPTGDDTTDHGVFAGDDAVVTRPVSVEVPEEPTTPTRPPPTFTASETPSQTAPTPSTEPTDGGDAADGDVDGECRRGFFTPCGGAAMGETSLTMVGILLSGFGIVFQMVQGRR